MTAKVKVFLVDDHGVVREGIKRLLERQPDLEVVGEASDAKEATAKLTSVDPDVVLMDETMPGMRGVVATQEVKRLRPATRILALTVHEDDGYAREFLKAGATGFLLKRAPTDELVRAIRVVASGGTYIDPRIAGRLLKTFPEPGSPPDSARVVELSEREAEVLRLIALGYSNKEIAAQLDVSVKTVETYKARSMEKLRLRSRVDIVRLAAERGWLTRSADAA